MISTKGRNALKTMIDLVEQNSNDYIPLKDIAKRQGISKKYLEAIVKKLVDKRVPCEYNLKCSLERAERRTLKTS